MVVLKLTYPVVLPLDTFDNSTIQDYYSIRQSDIAMFSSDCALWINGTEPVVLSIADFSTAPNQRFPFPRLASVTLADQSATFLYHQINGTTFAEEQWDASENAGIPSVFIDVSDD